MYNFVVILNRLLLKVNSFLNESMNLGEIDTFLIFGFEMNLREINIIYNWRDDRLILF